ncbi:MAG: hypothetical protein GY886_09920 [Gammaproteobacteria bacterium]|nr:hypothetical protein [Gammaproteobacteria bacterium]
MEYQEFHAKWQNLIFTPLDISNPPCDAQQLQKFMDMYPGHSHEDNMNHIVHGAYPERNHDPETLYDFYRSFHVINTKFSKPWKCEVFAEMFPDIPEWLRSLPLAPEKRFAFGWINQLRDQDVPDINFKTTSNIHVDEPGSFGLRWFFNNSDNNLYFYGTKPDITIPDIITSNPNTDTNYHLYHDTINNQLNSDDIPRANNNFYSKPIKISTTSHTSFMLGQQKAAHVIKSESHNYKSTFILEPLGRFEDRWLWSELDHIVEQSVNNHRSETIWHEDFCD